jgi:nucleoside-diphosphate-sugar epimerase
MASEYIRSLEQLEDLLSKPTSRVIDALAKLEGDFIILGVAGKMGPSLARMIKRASDAAGAKRRIIGVARFSAKPVQAQLHARGIETIQCDLLDESAVQKLPDAANVLYLAGMKFGSTGQEAMTWAMNSYLPAVISKKYRQSRSVALSTGNVYGLINVKEGGSTETASLAPVGEYAMSCLGRERIFEHFSQQLNTPMTLIRLNYACDLRYGVLVDLARKVRDGVAIDLSMGYFNTIWQGDANAMILQAFDQATCPPTILNVTGRETLAVREVCERFGSFMNCSPKFVGRESPTALLSDARRASQLFGASTMSAEKLISWVADWVMRGGASLDKPTHFESRDGQF